jgi:hypothetical protein
MLANLMGGLVDKEKITHDTIQSTLEEVAEELGVDHSEFFIMIKPVSVTYTMKFYIYRMQNEAPKLIREITLKEIFSVEPDDE